MIRARSLLGRYFWPLALLFAFTLPGAGAGEPVKLAPLPKAFVKNTPETVGELKEIQDHVKAVVKKVTPTVVGLQIGMAQGSGVIIDKEGTVLTAGHVSGDPDRPATIILPDGRRLKGKTLGGNRGIDSGMVKIILSEKDKLELPVVEMAKSSELKRGDWCLAIGHPGGFQKGRDPVVRLGRILEATDKYIRTDCTLVGGDSGGPLFDMYGRVIGIHSRIGPVITFNIHVPVDTFRDNFDKLAAGEIWGGGMFGAIVRGAYLGLKLDGESKTCLVDEVLDGSPAARAGLKNGDVVTMIEKHRVANVDDLHRFLNTMTPGSQIDIKVQRGEETLTLRVTLGNRPKDKG